MKQLATAPAGAGQDQMAGHDAALGDIIVTAQRRSENLQNVPIAITAITSDQLANAGVSSLQNLQVAVPGLAFAQVVGYSLPRIRGVGTGSAGPGLESSVALYIDNVYIGSPFAGQLAFNNIAQTAVLKGPQGTLFGRNATGGVIQVTTRDPGQTLVGDVAGTIGSRSTIGTSAYVNLPISGQLAADFAFYYNNQRGGFGRNLVTGNQVGTERDVGIRSKIIWKPTDTTTVRAAVDYATARGARIASRVVKGTVPTSGEPFTGGDFDIYATVDPFQRINQKGASIQIDQRVGSLSLVSITAWRGGLIEDTFDSDAQPAPITLVQLRQNDRQFSQELQLLSSKDGPFSWMVGGFYYNAVGRYPYFQITSRAAPFVTPPTNISQTDRQSTKSYAAFSQATLALGGATNVTAGLRYTSDRRTNANRQVVTLPNGVSLPARSSQGERTFNKLTWRLSVDHRFSDEALAYASYNRGFKSGLFDPVTIPLNAVDPEVLDAYEIGVKLDLLDRKLRVNAAAFHYRYNNVQISRTLNGTILLLNGADARVNGLDVDATIRLGSGFTIATGLSYLDDRFTNFPGAIISTPLPAGGNAISAGNAAGKRLPMTPDWTFNASPTYGVETAGGRFEATATYLHNDGYYESAENRQRQKPFDLVNATLSWNAPSGHVYAALWAKNIFNKFYATQLSAQTRGDVVIAGDGRTYGLTVGARF